MRLACKPTRLSFLTAISRFACRSTELLIVPLYTHPKPPSPSICERLKFRVATFSSSNLNILRSFNLWENLENLNLPVESVLMSETFLEVKSDTDFFVSWSVDVVLLEKCIAILLTWGSCFPSLFKKWKHFMDSIWKALSKYVYYLRNSQGKIA